MNRKKSVGKNIKYRKHKSYSNRFKTITIIIEYIVEINNWIKNTKWFFQLDYNVKYNSENFIHT